MRSVAESIRRLPRIPATKAGPKTGGWNSWNGRKEPLAKSAYHWEVWHLKFYGGGPERNAEWDGMNLDEGSVTMAKWIVKHTKK